MTASSESVKKISYARLWALLTERKMKKDLQLQTHLSSAVIAKLGKDLPVHLSTLVKSCDVLQCNLFDIVEMRVPIKAK